jgi:hypothetical protein
MTTAGGPAGTLFPRGVTAGSRTHAWLSAAGLAVGAAGVGLQALAGADLPLPVPPGVVILAVAAVLTAAVRSPWMPAGTALVAVYALLNVLNDPGSGALVGSEGVGVAAGKWLLLAGAGTALVASLLALRTTRRRRALRGRAGRTEGCQGTEPRREDVWPRRLQIAGLLVLAPVCAEYLSAYDDSTGSPLALLGGLFIFIPLYGAPALLIREVSRRAGLGWLGIVLLAAAFGLTEAGVVDQSLFSLDYRHIESWDSGLRGTFLGPLGLSAYNALNFVGGHVIYSICAPIALVEAFRPLRDREPWLSRWTLAGTAVLYAAASALVLNDSLTHESSHASRYQVSGSVAVIGLLVLGAFATGRRHTVSSDRPAPRARTVFLLALVVAVVYNLAPPTWAGVTLTALTLVAGCAFVFRASGSPGWSLQHVVALAAAAVLTRAVLSFTYFPVIGDVSALGKYGHSTVFLIAMATICLLASRRSTSHTSRSTSTDAEPLGVGRPNGKPHT